MTRRPYRQRKADRLMEPGATSDEIRCDFVLGPLDNLARKMDRKWGIDRLPDLVSVETAARYGRAMAGVIQAQRDCDEARLMTLVQNAQRGLLAMDKQATEAGEQPATAQAIEYDCDGFKFGVMPDDRNWQAEHAARPDLKIFTMREIGVVLMALAANGQNIEKTRSTATASLAGIIKRAGKNPESEIPF